MAATDLLYLRLEALEKDIKKVSGAVTRAKERSQFLTTAREHIEPCKKDIKFVVDLVASLVDCVDEDSEVGERLDNARRHLVADLREAQGLMKGLKDAVSEARRQVNYAWERTVSLDEQSSALEDSLGTRCEEVCKGIRDLKQKVSGSQVDEQADRWTEYQALLDNVARPVFIEYVDFLGGLTVRDAGLDDRVCGMTDGLLTRFKGATGHLPLPLPARQAALGSALDSVVLLGFPEWSIWGIPLVGHEVGLAWAKIGYGSDFASLIDKYVPMVPSGEEVPPSGGEKDDRLRAEEAKEKAKDYVRQLLADVFATFTLGFSYACAALLLRLSPRADEPPEPGMPRDIDRGRVIIATLSGDGDTTPGEGGEFTDMLGDLQAKWDDAVREFARPGQVGKPEDWLEEFTKHAIAYLRGRHSTIPPYDQERWLHSDEWVKTLSSKLEGTPVRPIWGPPGDDVPDMLTAAWRLRLKGVDPTRLAACVTELWDGGRKGA